MNVIKRPILIITYENYNITTNNQNKNLNYDYQLIKKTSHINIFKQIKIIIEQQKHNYEYFFIDVTKKHENTFITINANELIERLKEKNKTLVFPCLNDSYKEYPPVVYDILKFKTQSIHSIVNKKRHITSKLCIGTYEQLIEIMKTNNFNELDEILNNNYTNTIVDHMSDFFSYVDNTSILSYISNENDIIGYIRPYTIIHFTETIPSIFSSYDNRYIANDNNITYVCVNLKERTDRYDNMNKLFKKIGLTKVKYFFADRHQNGAMYGCYDSHVKAMDMGEQDITIIFEDDSTLYDEIDAPKFKKIINQLKFYLTIGYDFFSFGCIPLPNYSTLLNTDFVDRALIHGHFITALGYAIKTDTFKKSRNNMMEYIGHIHYDMYYAISDIKKIGLAEPILYQNFNDTNNTWMPTSLSALSDIEGYIRETLSKTIKYARNDEDLTYKDIAMIRSFSFLAYTYVKIGRHKMC